MPENSKKYIHKNKWHTYNTVCMADSYSTFTFSGHGKVQQFKQPVLHYSSSTQMQCFTLRKHLKLTP